MSGERPADGQARRRPAALAAAPVPDPARSARADRRQLDLPRAFTRDSTFFYAMLLLHLALGLLMADPLLHLRPTHAKRMVRMWNKRAKAAGFAIVTLLASCASRPASS